MQGEYYFPGNKCQDFAGRYVASTSQNIKCFFGGNTVHPRALCPAREAFCHKCEKEGHFQRVCKSTAIIESQSSYLTLASLKHSAAESLKKACVGVLINGKSAQALVDSESAHNFIHPGIAKSLGLVIYPTLEKVTMTSSHSSEIEGYCFADIMLKDRVYRNMKLYILSNLCTDRTGSSSMRV